VVVDGIRAPPAQADDDVRAPDLLVVEVLHDGVAELVPSDHVVHESGDKVRFQHSIVQAYLGSRFLGEMFRPPDPAGPAGSSSSHTAEGPSPDAHVARALRQGGREPGPDANRRARGIGPGTGPVSSDGRRFAQVSRSR
jgi:hypothetical protein